jgi:putative membrane protein
VRARTVNTSDRRVYTLCVLVALLVRWVALAVAFAITSWLLSGMNVSGGIGGYLWIAALFGVVNAILGTILRLLTLPLMIITLGLFSIVVNALMLELVDALSDHLTIDHFFWTAIWAAIILSVVSVILHLILGAVSRREPAIA